MKDRVIALGFFDGVHLGHGALLKETVRLARQERCSSAALSFTGGVAGKSGLLLNTVEDRTELMRRLWQTEEVLLLPFDEKLMHMAPEAFVTMLAETCGARHLVAGYDFTYGYRGAGNAGTLSRQCGELGIGCTIVPPVEAEGIRISTRGIRERMVRGEMEQAVRLLGHPHVLTAAVEPGFRLGRTMGVPTVNQRLPADVVIPARGVYAVRVCLPDGRAFFGAANIGTRPTVSDGDAVTVETHLQGFSGDLYGQKLRTEFFAMLREERRFDSRKALAEQIRRDGEAALRWFETHREAVQPVTPELAAYAEQTILPRYAGFDRGHDEAHIRQVMREAMELARGYDLVPDMVYCMAAYHDLGMPQGRKTHHLTSAKLLREDEGLTAWFSPEQREVMAQAVEDHRASAEAPPRSLYGRLLCDADRCLEPETVVRRTLDFGAANYPGLSAGEQFSRMRQHLKEKYGEGGYLHLQLGAEKTLRELAALRSVIRDEGKLRALFETWQKTENSGKIV